MGPRNAVLCGGDACGHPHWSLRWSSLWGHEKGVLGGRETCDTPTGAFGGTPNGATKRCPGWGRRMRPPHWGPPWSSQWGHETLSWVGETHAAPTGAFRGAPHGATKRYTVCAEAEVCEEHGGDDDDGKGGWGQREEEGTRGAFSSKRGPKTTGWVGKHECRRAWEACQRLLGRPYKAPPRLCDRFQ